MGAGKPNFETYRAKAPPETFPNEKFYELNMRLIKEEISNCALFSTWPAMMASMAKTYSTARPSLLFGDSLPEPRLLQKPYESLLTKIYRQNVVWNRNFPDPPDEGWTDAANVFSKVDDLIRTRLTCKYMDGPAFVCHIFEDFCREGKFRCRLKPMNTDRGYYAWHFYAFFPVDLFAGKDVISQEVGVEIQVTTQLMEVMDALTHDLYDRQKLQAEKSQKSWEWNPDDNQFKATYMGHALHLLEGTILGLKNDVFKTEPAAKIDCDIKILKVENNDA